MKQRRAVLALGISIIVLAALVVARRITRGPLSPARPAPPTASAASVTPTRSVPPPVLSASVPPPSPARPPAPPYLDTTATTLAEQRDALFTNMQNQLEL